MTRKKIILALDAIILSLVLVTFGCHSSEPSYEIRPSSEIISEILSKIESGQFRKVEGYIDDLVNRKPFSIDGTRVLEDVYEGLSDRRKIISHLNEWCASHPQHQAPHIIRGKYYIHSAWRERGSGWGHTVSDEMSKSFRNELLLAKKDFETAYKNEPDDPNSCSSMITVCMGLGLEKRIMDEWFSNAIKADSSATDAYRRKMCYLFPKWHGSQKESSEFGERCYQASPPGSIVYTTMYDYIVENAERSNDREAFFSQKEIQTLLSNIFSRWKRDFPRSALIHSCEAYLNSIKGNTQRAIMLYSRAIGIDPENPRYLRNRANCQVRVGNRSGLKEAEKTFIKVLSVCPDDDKSLYGLGNIYRHLYFDMSKAFEYYNRAIKLNQTDPWYFLKRADTRSSQTLKDYSGAFEDYRQALALNNRFVQAYFERGLLYRQMGENDKTKEDFQMAETLLEEEMAKGDSASISKETESHILTTIAFISCRNKTQITPLEAERLAKSKGSVQLDALEVLDMEILTILKSNKLALGLNGLKTISSEIASGLSTYSGSLSLDGLESISKEIACILGVYSGRLSLNGLKTLTPETAACLSAEKQSLSLNGLTEMTPPIAEHLCKISGALYLNGIKSLDPDSADFLAKLAGGLYLRGIKSLSSETAESLIIHNNPVSLSGIVVMAPEIAEILSKKKSSLTLDGIIDLSPALAKCLAKHEGSLSLNGVEALTPDVAKCFEDHKGSLNFNGLVTLSAEILLSLSKNEGSVWLYGLTEVDTKTMDLINGNSQFRIKKGNIVVSPSI